MNDPSYAGEHDQPGTGVDSQGKYEEAERDAPTDTGLEGVRAGQETPIYAGERVLPCPSPSVCWIQGDAWRQPSDYYSMFPT